MADPETLRTTGLFAGLALQLIGLVVVIVQLRRVNASIRVSAQASLYQQSSSVRSALIEYPSLRRYFYEGRNIDPESEDYHRVRTIAEEFLNYLEHLVIQRGSLRDDEFSAWNRFVYRTISSSPVMREILDENPDLYSRDLVRACEEGRPRAD
ncbi:MAG: hypothetical protein R3323_05875 [Wenzhouxiangellaceae bacterium]|nr:hypothetical protein [Wenzhouxiangellaceae bacterium]